MPWAAGLRPSLLHQLCWLRSSAAVPGKQVKDTGPTPRAGAARLCLCVQPQLQLSQGKHTCHGSSFFFQHTLSPVCSFLRLLTRTFLTFSSLPLVTRWPELKLRHQVESLQGWLQRDGLLRPARAKGGQGWNLHPSCHCGTAHSCLCGPFSSCFKVSPSLNIWGGGWWRWMICPRCIRCIFQIMSLFTSCAVSKS